MRCEPPTSSASACRATSGARRRAPLELVEAVETLARADASAGWCLAVTATSGLVAAYLDEDAAREVYGSAGVAVGGVFAPRGQRAWARVTGSRSAGAGRSPAAARSATG